MVAFALFLFLMILQIWAGSVSKSYKNTESGINDERLKFVNDLVVGSRTIKCYGWELYYMDKINQIRRSQMKYVLKLNLVSSLGSVLFQNMGLVVILIILASQWGLGVYLRSDTSVSMLSMIYFVFLSVNVLTYVGLTNTQNFLAILFRLSQVMEMEAYKR